MQEEERLSLREAANALGISEVSARRWIKSGKLKAYKPGLKYLIPKSAVKELLEGSATEDQPDLERIIAMDMTEFAQYIATIDDAAVQGLREQLDAEAARRHSTDLGASQRLAVRSFIAGLDLQVRKEQVTREQLNAIVAAV